MRRLHGIFPIALLLAGVACGSPEPTAPAAPGASAVQADVIITRLDLGTLGGSSSSAHDLNNAGVVVGTARMADETERAFRWTLQSGMVALPLPAGYSWSHGFHVTPSGKIYGEAGGPGLVNAQVVWGPGGEVIVPRLRPPAEGQEYFPVAMSDLNQIVGYAYDADDTYGFLWSQPTGFVNLEHAVHSSEAWPSDISPGGIVTGTYVVCDHFGCQYHGFTWSVGGQVVDLGWPPYVVGFDSPVVPTSVNDRGYVAGYYYNQGDGIAFVWKQGLGYRSLPGLSTERGRWSQANDVNLSGTAVGTSAGPEGTPSAGVVWPATGGMRILATADGGGGVPLAINDHDMIAGWRDTPAGPQAVVWRLTAGMSTDTGASAE